MSHIFDALQRSVTERSDIDRPRLSGIAALLQLAERREVSKWETTNLPEQPGAPKTSWMSTALELEEKPMAAEPLSSSEASDGVSAENSLDLLAQFKSLTIALAPESHLPCITESGSPAAEAFRLLGVRLRHLRRERPLKKVLITSTIPQEGKSTVAANLACTLGLKTQEKILVVEGDLRRPSLVQMFGVKNKPGLSEWLESERDPATIIYRLDGLNTWILPAGSAPSNALELLQSTRLSILIQRLTQMFDWIIIDSPPVLPLADTSVWMRLADGILIVARQGTTEKRKLQRGLEAIEPEKLVGALINSSSNAVNNDYYSYYGPRQTAVSIDSQSSSRNLQG
jgi:capsular exopolysaccharide synthesis family protein